MSPLNITLGQLIDQLADDLPGADPVAMVREAQLRAHTMDNLGDQLVDHFVSQARASGASWSQIGDALGVSKQAAQQRRQSTFERYTTRARNVVIKAEETARAHRHGAIEPAHLLAALLGEEHGLAAVILLEHGESAEAVKALVAGALPEDGTDATPAHIRFSDESRAVLERTPEQAIALGHNYVGTEHLLLGLRQATGPTAEVLDTLGLTAEVVVQDLQRHLQGYLAAAAKAAEATKSDNQK